MKLQIGDTVVSLKTDSHKGTFNGSVEKGKIYTVTKLMPNEQVSYSCICVDGQSFGFYEKSFLKIIGGKKIRTLEELKVTVTETKNNFGFEIEPETPINMNNGTEIIELYTAILERVKQSKLMNEEQMLNCSLNVVARFTEHLNYIAKTRLIDKLTNKLVK